MRSRRPRSDTHRSCVRSVGAQRGYSLFEIIVVLAIITVALGMIAPAAVSGVASLEFRSKSESVAADIVELRLDAAMRQRTIGIGAALSVADPAQIDLPEGWLVEADGEPVFFLPSGVCTGGRVLISNPEGRRVALNLTAPNCALTELTPTTPASDQR